MQPNRGSKFQSIISVESRKSNLSISRSLGRPSWQMINPSIDRKVSSVYAMSIQSGDNRRSDIFQRLLQSDKKPSYNRASNAAEFSLVENYYNQNNGHNTFSQQQRNSQGGDMRNQLQIDHQCRCFHDCYQKECPCFMAKNQMCIKRTCCIKCVQLKTFLLRGNTFSSVNGNFQPYNINNQEQLIQKEQSYISSTEPILCNCKNTQCLKSYCKCFQNGQFCNPSCGCQSCKNKTHSEQRQLAIQSLKTNNQITYCTCKKTKCNKKYCSCYASGMKCGKHCSCQNCTNCVKNDKMDIEVYEGEEQQDYKNLDMPEKMSFQPVNFNE